MLYRFAATIAAMLSAAAILFAVAGGGAQPAFANPPVNTIAIDANTAGNTPTSIGTIQSCASIPGVGGTATIDVVVDSIPSGPPNDIFGFGFNLLYNPAIVHVTAKASIPATSLIAAIPPSFIVTFSNSLPDFDGDFQAVELDVSTNYESGPGTLIRLTFTAAGVGTSPITLTDTGGGDFDGIPDVYASDTSMYAFGSVQSGQIVVGSSCGPQALGVGGFSELTVSGDSGGSPTPLEIGLAGSALVLLTSAASWTWLRRRSQHTS